MLLLGEFIILNTFIIRITRIVSSIGIYCSKNLLLS